MSRKRPQNLGKKIRNSNRNVTISESGKKQEVNSLSPHDRMIDFVKSYIVPIIAPIIATLLLNTFMQACKHEPSEMEIVQERIKGLEDQLTIDAIESDTSLFNNKAKLGHLKRFHYYISLLSHYANSHEKCDFKGISLQESFDLAIDNLSKRNSFDKLSLDIIVEIDSLDYVYQHSLYEYDGKKKVMEKSVRNWVGPDTLRNNRLIELLKGSRNSSNKIMRESLREVKKELTSLNEDINHYYFKANFYDYIIEIRNLCKLYSNESETLDMENL